MAKVPSTESESHHAILLADFLRHKGLLFTHIVNEFIGEGNWGIIQNQKRAGKSKGVPDYMICIPAKGEYPPSLLFIELKKEKGGTVSIEQKHWLASLHAIPNVSAHICRGAIDAIKLVNSLL
jgi:hypothetical protein